MSSRKLQPLLKELQYHRPCPCLNDLESSCSSTSCSNPRQNTSEAHAYGGFRWEVFRKQPSILSSTKLRLPTTRTSSTWINTKQLLSGDFRMQGYGPCSIISKSSLRTAMRSLYHIRLPSRWPGRIRPRLKLSTLPLADWQPTTVGTVCLTVKNASLQSIEAITVLNSSRTSKNITGRSRNTMDELAGLNKASLPGCNHANSRATSLNLRSQIGFPSLSYFSLHVLTRLNGEFYAHVYPFHSNFFRKVHPAGALLFSGVHSHLILLQHLCIHLTSAKRPIWLISEVPKYWVEQDGTLCLDKSIPTLFPPSGRGRIKRAEEIARKNNQIGEAS